AGIVKNDTERMPLARAHATDAMSEIDAVVTARAAHRSVMDRKHNTVALLERHHFGARLHARPLLGEHEFAAGELTRLREKHGQLQREHTFAVKILMQAVVIARPILQNTGRRLNLTSGVAAREDCIER